MPTRCMVVSVLMYNASCWAVPVSQLKRVDTMQRRHLRKILRIRWPHRISNEALYARCACGPLSERVHDARWRMLGHILRLPRAAPAQQALDFAVRCHGYRRRHGTAQTNLLGMVTKDVEARGWRLRVGSDLEHLRVMASDRDQWRAAGRAH